MSAMEGTAIAVETLIVALNQVRKSLAAERVSINAARQELIVELGATTDPWILRVEQGAVNAAQRLTEAVGHLRSAVDSAGAFAGEVGLPRLGDVQTGPGDGRTENRHTVDAMIGDTVIPHHDSGLGDVDWRDSNKFDPDVLRGYTAAEIDTAIPDSWERISSNRGGGITYRDPMNRGRQIRVMPGYSAGNRPDALTHNPYVVISQNGVKTKVPLRGNPLAGGC